MASDSPKKAPRRPTPPKSLATAGSALWRRYTEELEYAPHELPLLECACRQADTVAALEVLLAAEGLTVAGSRGQPRLSPVVAELRQSRLALGKLLAQLAIPADDGEKPLSDRQRRAKHAADARWAKERRLRGVTSGPVSP